MYEKYLEYQIYLKNSVIEINNINVFIQKLDTSYFGIIYNAKLLRYNFG